MAGAVPRSTAAGRHRESGAGLNPSAARPAPTPPPPAWAGKPHTLPGTLSSDCDGKTPPHPVRARWCSAGVGAGAPVALAVHTALCWRGAVQGCCPHPGHAWRHPPRRHPAAHHSRRHPAALPWARSPHAQRLMHCGKRMSRHECTAAVWASRPPRAGHRGVADRCWNCSGAVEVQLCAVSDLEPAPAPA